MALQRGACDDNVADAAQGHVLLSVTATDTAGVDAPGTVPTATEYNEDMRIVIMGCGRVGAQLANTLHREHEITIIDESPEAFERLVPDFSGRTVVGPGDDPDVLVQADIRQADAFAALTNRDNANIMGSEMARELFHVPRVITRIYDHFREDTYHDLGLDTICPTEEGARYLEEAITDS